jgi:hypothetical protein
VHADCVDLAGLDDLEATVAVILVVAGARERRPNAGVDVTVICKKTFLRGMVEVRAVVDARLVRWGSAEDLGFPSVPNLG